jgi:hypothetical protein
MKRLLIAALLVLAAALCLEAQNMQQVSGVVQDGTGAVVVGAQVTITNTDTAYSRSTQTGADGSYVLTNLPVGPYRLEVVKEGFVKYLQTGIVLQVGINPQANVTLKLGAVSEQVEVSANATMVDTVSTAVGQVIDQQRVVDLPLNGRNVTQLISLSGAAVPTTGTGLVNTLNHPNVASFSIAGAQGNSTNYFLDGATHIDTRTNVGLPLPFPDALQEFKVESSSMPANYGSRPGGAVNAVTKAGTNEVHGDLFWFVRNGALNARNFFAPKRDSLKRNQFGGVIGGPIKKDKLFFFYGFQDTKERTAPVTNTAWVPTADVLKGDFRTILSAQCLASPVTLNAASGAVGNVIPTSLFDPVALNLASHLPLATDPCGKILYGVAARSDGAQHVLRMDWQRTPVDSIFFRGYIDDYSLTTGYDPKNILTATSPTASPVNDRVTALDLGDTHMLNSTTVSSLRLSYARSAVRRVVAGDVPTLADLGSKVTTPVPNFIGQLQVGNYISMNLPSGAIPAYSISNLYGISEGIGFTRGAHQINAGASLTQSRLDGLGMFQMNGRAIFTGAQTGNALADFMTGKVYTYLQGNGQIAKDTQNAPSIYFQDNWKINPHLQLNMGVRWDPFYPQHMRIGYVARFNMADFYAGKVSQKFVNAPPGVTYDGDPGVGNTNTNAKPWDLAPRIGLVIQPRSGGTETIRAGYGVFWDTTYLWNTTHVTLDPPWGNTITLTAPGGGISNPWRDYPGGNPFPTPANPPSDVAFPIAAGYKFQPTHSSPAYTQQWNIAYQRQLGSNLLLSATYLGNKTTHQWLGRELNPAVYSPGATTATTQARRVLNLARPETGKYFGSIIMVDDGGNASYNALLLSLNQRFAHGFSAMANYTWSHCFDQGESNQDIASMYQDPNNRRAEWASCAADFRQTLNISSIIQSPRVGSPLMQRVTGSWQLSIIFSATTGGPVNVTDGTDVSLSGVGLDRPNTVADATLSNPTIKKWFNTAAFQKQAPGTFGNTGRNSLRGPGAWNFDTSLTRNFQLQERLKMNLRFEAFNLFNHARFGNPSASLNSASFGQITTAMDPRILQMAMKFLF